MNLTINNELENEFDLKDLDVETQDVCMVNYKGFNIEIYPDVSQSDDSKSKDGILWVYTMETTNWYLEGGEVFDCEFNKSDIVKNCMGKIDEYWKERDSFITDVKGVISVLSTIINTSEKTKIKK